VNLQGEWTTLGHVVVEVVEVVEFVDVPIAKVAVLGNGRYDGAECFL
jgi:uncharacterized membrane protein YccF (DUF307 family)